VLHQRAGHWFAAHGLAAEAIQHALAARDWDHAARLIEEHGPLLAARGHVNAVLAWLAALPETLAAARPALDVLHGLALFFGSQLDAAELRLQAAESHLPGAPPDDRTRVVLGHIMVIRASIARYRGDLRGCIKLARQALALVPVTNALLRASPSLDVASDYVITGDVSPGNERPLVAAIAAAADTGDLQTHVTGLVLLGGFRRRQGRLREAVVAYREAAAIVSGPDGQLGLVNGAACYFRLGDVLREWNDLEAAAALLGRGHELVLGTFVTKADIVTLGYISIARLQHTRGDAAGARETLAQLHALVHERTFAPQLLVRVAAARAYLALLQGDLARAILWADTCGLAADDEYDYLREVPYLTLVRVRIAQGASDPAGPALRDAARLLDRITKNATAGARMDTVVECLILRALLLQARGEGNQAVAALEDALHLAAPEGYLRVVLDEGAPMARLLMAALQTPAFGAQRNDDVPAARAYAQQLLALLHAEDVELPVSAPDSGAVPQTQLPGGEQLTARELEVLQLLAAGRSNQAIAQELVVAIGTVKRHVNSIMGKLQVQSRLAAVAFAREQGIV
jgi:LuxR family maltose regulon positive regulatory protein